MRDMNGFTIVEILVVVVILAVVGLVMMVSVIPRIESNAKNNFITDAKLYIQAATKYYSDKKLEDESCTGGCVAISELNKMDVNVPGKKDYSGYVIVSLGENETKYAIAITNKYYYSFNRTDSNYAVNSDIFIEENVMSDYDNIKDFPTKCPKK